MGKAKFCRPISDSKRKGNSNFCRLDGLQEVNVATLKVIADSSKYYSRLRSKSIRVGMKQKKGGRPPFGMSYDENRNLVANEQWPIVQQIFSMKANDLAYLFDCSESRLT